MILWFSGTGNSAAVADKLSGILGDKTERIDLANPKTYPAPDKDRIIWVMPVHSWGMPKKMASFIKQVSIDGADKANHFLVATCGDDCGLTHKRWRKELRRRGWKAVAAHSVEMPNTYVLLPGFNTDSDILAQTKLDRMPERVARIAHAIKCSSKIDDIVKGHFAWIKSYLIYPLFMKLLTSPKPLTGTDKCISCGKCVAVCPMKNIRLERNDKPEWGKNCILCLGCYHICPRHAVAYGKATRNKGQWQGSLKKLF